MQISLSNFLFVGAGGTIGAILRYSVALFVDDSKFPYSTLIVNIVGSILLGFLVAWHGERELPAFLILFVGVGILGSLTTMSTFAVETINAGKISISILNVIITLLGVLIGAVMGKFVAISFHN